MYLYNFINSETNIDLLYNSIKLSKILFVCLSKLEIVNY